MNRICKYCGTPIPRETSRFCAGCGKPLSQEDIIAMGNMTTPVQQPYHQSQYYQQPVAQPTQKRTPTVHYSSQSQYAGQKQQQVRQRQMPQPQPQQQPFIPNQMIPMQNQAGYPYQEQRFPQLSIQPQPQQAQPSQSQSQPQQQNQSWQEQAQQAAQHAQSAMKMINGIMTVTASSTPGEMVVGEFGPDIIGIVTNAAANAARTAGSAVMNSAQQQLRQSPQPQYPQQGQWQGLPQQTPNKSQQHQNYQNGQ